MFGLFEIMFIGLLRFSRLLATKCLSLNNEKYKTRPTLFCLILL